jgi:hypothetical protein
MSTTRIRDVAAGIEGAVKALLAMTEESTSARA